MTAKMTRINIGVLLAISWLLAGCDSNESVNGIKVTPNSKLTDATVTEFNNLGWLGIRCYPLTQNLSFADPNDAESTVAPGGLVVAQVTPGSKAETAGFKKDDVIVAVEEDWLPINDDPTLDVIEQVETRVTSAEAETLIKVYRDGEIQSLTISNLAKSLDDGLPNSVARFSDAAMAGLKQLVAMQNEDGSFGDESCSQDSKLQITAVAGLALLSADSEDFQSAIDQTIAYVGRRLDEMSKPLDAGEAKSEKQGSETAADSLVKLAGATMIQMPELNIEPLTAAYVAQFLAESKVSMLEKTWMGRLIGITSSLSKSQSELGGWNLSEGRESDAVDVAATFATNQVLLGIGMLERMGVSANPETIKKACGYLSSQLTARAGSPVDRRIKAALTAGTGAALVSINCQPSDALLEQSTEDGLEWVDEMYLSPSLNLPGLLSVATLARQSGDEHWLSFHEGNKLFLTAVSDPNGQFVAYPRKNQKPLDFEVHCDDSAWQAAHFCLLLSMQSGRLESMTGTKKSPLGIARNGAGEASKTSSMRPGTPAGMPSNAKTMSFTLDNLSGEGSIEDQIKEKLKEMGIDADKVKMGTSGSMPADKKK